MPIIENTNDIILIIGAAAAALGGVIAGFRASRCRSINLCNGCLKIEREIKNGGRILLTQTLSINQRDR